MNLLGFDTSTEAFSVAISKAGVITEKFFIPEQKHTEILLAGIEQELQEASLSFSELDCLVYGRGPGAFTGVRLAVAVAQGLGFSAELPVSGISSLAAVAQQVYANTGNAKVAVALDARMSEVYFGAFEFSGSGEIQCVTDEQVCAPQDIRLPDTTGWVAAGTGWQAYTTQFSESVQALISVPSDARYPRASDMLTLARHDLKHELATPASAAIPVYLRNNVASKPGKK